MEKSKSSLIFLFLLELGYYYLFIFFMDAYKVCFILFFFIFTMQKFIMMELHVTLFFNISWNLFSFFQYAHSGVSFSSRKFSYNYSCFLSNDIHNSCNWLSFYEPHTFLLSVFSSCLVCFFLLKELLKSVTLISVELFYSILILFFVASNADFNSAITILVVLQSFFKISLSSFFILYFFLNYSIAFYYITFSF